MSLLGVTGQSLFNTQIIGSSPIMTKHNVIPLLDKGISTHEILWASTAMTVDFMSAMQNESAIDVRNPAIHYKKARIHKY